VFFRHRGWVLTASYDFTGRIWSASSGECLRVLSGHTGMVRGVGVSASGALLVTASADRTAKLWRSAGGEGCAYAVAHTLSHGGGVVSAVFSVDEESVLSASADCTARLWSTGSGECLRVFRGHQQGLSGATFTNC